MKTVWGYVSLVKQSYRPDPPSVEEQIRVLKHWAQDKNYRLRYIIVEKDNEPLDENGFLTDLFERRGIKRLMRDLKFNGIIITYDIWRFVKRPGDALQLALEILKKSQSEIYLECVKESTSIKTLAQVETICKLPFFLVLNQTIDQGFKQWEEAHSNVELASCEYLLEDI